jgi:hypothetical protein
MVLLSVLNMAFQKFDSVSFFRWNLLSWAQYIELVAVSGSEIKVYGGHNNNNK